MLQEFKDFINRGNLIDIAVAFVVGLAFAAVITSFTEDMLDQLNQVIVRQQDQIDRLQRELSELRERRPATDDASFRSLRDELPPHY